MTPSTIAGKIIASIACITGVMITAFPVSILVEHFTSTYKNKGKRMFVVPQFKYRMPFHKSRKNKDPSPKDIVMVRSQTTGR
uniref:Uncharacterized protein n=1 Tax=Romanomermis culicivorax TaxID=13658 RepID=A0A915HPZ5_ROMCU